MILFMETIWQKSLDEKMALPTYVFGRSGMFLLCDCRVTSRERIHLGCRVLLCYWIWISSPLEVSTYIHSK